jgi:dTDP-4-dehydrorhamnose 3,5-epimerase
MYFRAVTTRVFTTTLPGLLKIQRPEQPSEDEKNPFVEIADLAELSRISGKTFQTLQINHSHSMQNVLRGLHAEHWDKITWIARGQVMSVIVDIRPDSPTFGKYEIFELSDENRLALYIPEGFANSAYAITEIDYMYMVSKLYDGSDTFAVAWDDPDLAIPWPTKNPIISERDKQNPRLRELFPDKFQ